MPSTSGADIKTIGDIIYILTKCSSEQADAAEREICSRPKSVATLLTACGLAKYSIGAGGVLMVAGAANGGATVLPGFILSGAGLIAAKRYCYSAIDRATESIE